jgi:hypothetical protein
LKLKLASESSRFQRLNGISERKLAGESEDLGFFSSTLKTRKRHVVHMSCNHDGNLKGGRGTVTHFHHVLVEYDDGVGHIFHVENGGQFEEW